jgi:serine O-acetyltransferase
MLLSIKLENLCQYLCNQLNYFFPDSNVITSKEIFPFFSTAFRRIETNYSKIHLPYYNKENQSFFNHLHGDHYATFLYFLSNTLYLNGVDENICSKVFLLNKALHGIDAFYSIRLPEHFIFVHPLGTILGNADYGDFCVIYQGVTIGSNASSIYPKIGNNVIFYSNSSVIGNSLIGHNSVLGANSSVINHDISSFQIVTGNYPNIRLQS